MFVGGKFKADHQNMAVRKRKKDPPMDTPKSRTALLQEGENGVVTPKATTIVCMDALNAANIFSENSGSEEMEKEEDIINLISQTSDVESSGNIPKLRTALFHGRDDDVTIRSPNNYSENSFYDLAVSTGSSLEMPKHLKLGSYLFDMKKNNTKNELYYSYTMAQESICRS
jgi:hypothetical protein